MAFGPGDGGGELRNRKFMRYVSLSDDFDKLGAVYFYQSCFKIYITLNNLKVYVNMTAVLEHYLEQN